MIVNLVEEGDFSYMVLLDGNPILSNHSNTIMLLAMYSEDIDEDTDLDEEPYQIYCKCARPGTSPRWYRLSRAERTLNEWVQRIIEIGKGAKIDL